MPKDFTIDFVNKFFLRDIPFQNKDYQYSIIIIICLAYLCSILKDNTKALELLDDFIQFVEQKETLSQILIFNFNSKFDLNDLSVFFDYKNNIYLEKISFISILMLSIFTDDEKDALIFIEKLVQYLNLDKEIRSLKDYFNDNLKKEIPTETKLDSKIYNHISNYIDYRNNFKNTINLDKWNIIKSIFFEDLKKLSKKLNKYNYDIQDFDSYKKLELYSKKYTKKEDYLCEFIISNIHIEKLFDSINNFFESNKKEYEFKLEHIKKLQNEKNYINEKIDEFKYKIKDESNNIRNYSEICIHKIIEKFNIDLSKEITEKLSTDLYQFNKKKDKDILEFLNSKLNIIIIYWIEFNSYKIIQEQKDVSIEMSLNNLIKIIPNIRERFNKKDDIVQILNGNLTNFTLNDLSNIKKSLSDMKRNYSSNFFVDLAFSKNLLILLVKYIMAYYYSKNIYKFISKSVIAKELKENKIDEKIRLAIKNEIEKFFDSLAKDFENSFADIFNEMNFQLDIVTKDYNNYLKRIDDSEKSIKEKVLNLEIDIAKIQSLKQHLKTKLSKIYNK